MAWYLLKVQPAHEVRIRSELAHKLREAGIDAVIGLPNAPVRTFSQNMGKLLKSHVGRHYIKLRPGMLFLKIDDPLEAFSVLESVRGIGAINCCDGKPRPVEDELASFLDRGTFPHFDIEQMEHVRI